MRLAEVAGDRMKAFLRDSFSTILEGVKIPHKISSGYIDECIVLLIKHVTFKCAIVHVMHEIKESKSKTVRERCLVSELVGLFFARSIIYFCFHL
jgi:hypothetical protein